MAASLTALSFAPRPGFADFLERAGWGAADVRPLAGDASFRHYFRLTDRGRRAVLMDAPPEHEDIRPFVRVDDLLLRHGFAAPRILAAEEAQGFLLLEDFGDRRLGPLLAAEPLWEDRLYPVAVALLAKLHHVAPPGFLPPYDRDALLREVLLFPEWYLRAAGIEADVPGFVAAWDRVWGDVLRETAARPVVALRDYHADNLMLLEGAPAPGALEGAADSAARLGLLDFQDALAGHPAYDLVSLLQDARRDVSPRLERAMLMHYLRAAHVADGEAFRAAYEILGAQRNVKILGIFVRLRDRDGRKGYVERLPRVWGYLERNFRHPALAPVRQWFDAHVPAPLRAGWRG